MAVRYVPKPPVIEGWDHRTSQPNLVLQDQLALSVPFKPARWDQDYDDSAFWVQKSYPFPPLFVTPFVPSAHFWKYNYDDSAIWVRDSYPKPPIQMPIGGGFPFIPRQWKRDYDEPAPWTVKSRGFTVLYRTNLVIPLIPRRWAFDYNDASHWMPPRLQRPAGPSLSTEFVYAVILGN